MELKWIMLPLTILAIINWPEGSVHHPPGVLVEDYPKQENLADQASWKHNDFIITPLARFELEGLVLLKERFFMGTKANLSPLDLTVAWGPMSDQSIIDQITFTHSGRFYNWRTSDAPPVPPQVINSNVANLHLVPSNDETLDILRSARKGSIINISGYLIKAENKEGWEWKSSLTRTDTGRGACEIVWVEFARVSQ